MWRTTAPTTLASLFPGAPLSKNSAPEVKPNLIRDLVKRKPATVHRGGFFLAWLFSPVNSHAPLKHCALYLCPVCVRQQEKTAL
jgi:hypothetical protein